MCLHYGGGRPRRMKIGTWRQKTTTKTTTTTTKNQQKIGGSTSFSTRPSAKYYELEIVLCAMTKIHKLRAFRDSEVVRLWEEKSAPSEGRTHDLRIAHRLAVILIV